MPRYLVTYQHDRRRTTRVATILAGNAKRAHYHAERRRRGQERIVGDPQEVQER